jgi:hypothetical protein
MFQAGFELETIENCMNDSFEQSNQEMKENLSDNLLLKTE